MATQPDSPELPLARIQLLTDVLFASSMTIMVLGVDLPGKEEIQGRRDVYEFLAEQLDNLAIYGVTFLLIAVYWLKHVEHFSYYRRTNQTHLWLQLSFLMFLVLIPFTNGFSSAFPDNQATQILYSANMIAVGLASFFSWSYATRDRRLVDADLDAALIASVRAETVSEPLVAGVALVVSFLAPQLWELTFLLVPLLFAVRKRLRRRRNGG